ncbi:unnamed protein product [Urochloa decumbens]|uniref:Uncharacterized protein n=1 Tax=Urochloa decumbens TaxID=240449 RepID=A0ABC9C0L4_9POAL
MKLRLDHLIEDHLTKDRPGQVALPKLKNHDFEDDWHILEKEEIVVKAHGQEKDPWNGLVLKLNTLAGPVYGLSFNHHYPSMLACAAFGEKIRIYYLDHPHELTSRGKERLNTQMTFLDWSPINPAILASTCDIGETKIWDLRENGSKSTYAQELSCSEVHWNPCNPMMFAVTSTVDCKSPVKIWDVRNKFEALHKFGNGKGVTSLSWSASGLITTTDIDGAIDCWTKDENGEPVSCSSLATGSIEARWCESDATTATISPLHVEVYRMPAGQCIWQDPHFPDPY